MKTNLLRDPQFVELNGNYHVRISAITEVWLSAGDKDTPPVWRFRLSTTPVASTPQQFYSVGKTYAKNFLKLVCGAVEGGA